MDIESVQVAKGRYALRRRRDGRGDSGNLLRCFRLKEDESEIEELESGMLQVGYVVRCGNFFPSSHGSDRWQTTPITRFLFVEKDEEGLATQVTFKTGNSEYKLTVF